MKRKLILIMSLIVLAVVISFGHPKHKQSRERHKTEQSRHEMRGRHNKSEMKGRHERQTEEGHKKTASIYVGHLISNFEG